MMGIFLCVCDALPVLSISAPMPCLSCCSKSIYALTLHATGIKKRGRDLFPLLRQLQSIDCDIKVAGFPAFA